jgi:hypothetical protein
MFCHGELARMKPHARYLTSFYLALSIGGAAGGLFVALAAPNLFPGFFELPAGIVACAFLAMLIQREDRVMSWVWVVATAALAGVLFADLRHEMAGTRLSARNFYGALRVIDEGEGDEKVRKLYHGAINHGAQYLLKEWRGTQTTYYSPASGVGLAIEHTRRPGQRIGVVGLGTGTLAAYGREGDRHRFYEINPLVVRLARTEFTFLKDSRAAVDVVLGDGRLSLEQEPPQGFDVLAVDAFSGDSIPVHLLTRQAFDLYFRHLNPGGILAVHISNKYLDLEPVVGQLAGALGKQSLTVDTDDDEQDPEVFGSTWVLVGSSAFPPGLAGHGKPAATHKKLALWTDDYSNLFQILK